MGRNHSPVHMGHITGPDDDVPLDAFSYNILMGKFGTSGRGIGQIQHPDQRPVAVFQPVTLAVNSGIAAARGVPLNIGVVRETQGPQTVGTRRVVVLVDIGLYEITQAFKKRGNLAVEPDGHAEVD